MNTVRAAKIVAGVIRLGVDAAVVYFLYQIANNTHATAVFTYGIGKMIAALAAQ